MGLEERIKAAGAWNYRGVMFYSERRIKDAMACYDRAIEIDSECIDAWNNKGLILADLGKLEEAIICYDEAIKINPKYTKAWNNKAITLIKKGMPQEAIKCYDKALEINPRLFGEWNNKGALLEDLGRLEEAIKCFEKAIEINPHNADSWNGKGYVFSRWDNNDEALACFEKATEINPKDEGLWYNKGLSLKKLGRLEEAIKCFEKAIEINPQRADAWNGKGTESEKLGKLEEAIECYDKAIEINPKDEGPWYNKGNTLLRLERSDEALKCFEKAIEINPQYAEAWHGKGAALAKNEKDKEALKCFEKAIEINPQYAEAWNGKGYILSEWKRYDEALACFETTLNINPKYLLAAINKGAVYNIKKEYSLAFTCGLYALSIDKNSDKVFDMFFRTFSRISDNTRNLDLIEQELLASGSNKYVGNIVLPFLVYAGSTIGAKENMPRIMRILRMDSSLLSEKEGAFVPIDKSRNIVRSTHFEFDKYIGEKNIICKIAQNEQSRRRIEEEHTVTLWLYTNLEDFNKSQDESIEVYEVAKPLVNLKDEQTTIYINQKIAGKNLSEILKTATKEEKETYARQAIATMAKIASIATKELKRTGNSLEICIADGQNNSYNCILTELDTIADVKKRFIERLPAKKTTFRNPAKKFLQGYETFMNGDEVRAFQNTDSYPWNWIISAHGATSIDYETKAYANIFTDLACLLESEEFNEIDKEKQIYFYLNELRKYDPKLADKALSDWKKQYQKAAIHRTLTKTGAAYSTGDIHTAQYNIQRTTKLLETNPTLQKAFKKYIKATELNEIIA